MKFSLSLQIVVLVAALAAASVSPAGGFDPNDPIPDVIPKSSITVRLETIATNLVAPNQLNHAGDGTDRLFVVDQAGEINLIKNGVLEPQAYLDTSSLLVPLGVFGSFDPFTDFDERGLLGLAFHPDFENSGQPGFGKLYTYTSEPVGPAADFTVPIDPGEEFNHQSVVREWTVDPTSDQIVGDPNTLSRVLMRVDEPQANHNSGQLAFGPDGQLYITIGDGGSANDFDVGHSPQGNGQDPTNVLGTMLRIDPLGDNSTNGQYGIPGDNPFLADGSIPDEIFATGLRNAFRFSFDTDPATGLDSPETTGRLVVADVGQAAIEEVNIVEAGDNLGWRLKEGSLFFNFKTAEVSDVPFADPDIVIPSDFDLVDPVLEYDHDEGISIIGGFVYRGSEIPELAGKYVFGDFTQQFFNPSGRLFVGDLDTGEIEELRLDGGDPPLGLFVKGFGQDADGELYLLAGSNLGPFRDDNGQGFGVVFRISRIPEPATMLLLLAGMPLVLVINRRRKHGR